VLTTWHGVDAEPSIEGEDFLLSAMLVQAHHKTVPPPMWCTTPMQLSSYTLWHKELVVLVRRGGGSPDCGQPVRHVHQAMLAQRDTILAQLTIASPMKQEPS